MCSIVPPPQLALLLLLALLMTPAASLSITPASPAAAPHPLYARQPPKAALRVARSFANGHASESESASCASVPLYRALHGEVAAPHARFWTALEHDAATGGHQLWFQKHERAYSDIVDYALSPLRSHPATHFALDVGANVGWYSLYAASRGYDAHAVEMQPECVRRARCAAVMNRVAHRVVLFNAYATDGSEDGRFLPVAATTCFGGLNTAWQRRFEWPGFKDRVPPLHLGQHIVRAHADSGRRVGVLKVDIEGGEVTVARSLGAAPGALALVDHIVAEYSPHMWGELNISAADGVAAFAPLFAAGFVAADVPENRRIDPETWRRAPATPDAPAHGLPPGTLIRDVVSLASYTAWAFDEYQLGGFRIFTLWFFREAQPGALAAGAQERHAHGDAPSVNEDPFAGHAARPHPSTADEGAHTRGEVSRTAVEPKGGALVPSLISSAAVAGSVTQRDGGHAAVRVAGSQSGGGSSAGDTAEGGDGLIPAAAAPDVDDGVHLDFLEIGTSDFDTLLQQHFDAQQQQQQQPAGGEPQQQGGGAAVVGLSVEPLCGYLDALPSPPRVVKVCAAVTGALQPGDPRNTTVYHVDPRDIAAHGLSGYLRGCSSIGAPHPTASRELAARGLGHLLRATPVPLLPLGELLAAHRVASIQLLKLDTEGHDTVILRGLLAHCDARASEDAAATAAAAAAAARRRASPPQPQPPAGAAAATAAATVSATTGSGHHACWPRRILFESNVLTARVDLLRTVAALAARGYVVVGATDDDTLLELASVAAH